MFIGPRTERLLRIGSNFSDQEAFPQKSPLRKGFFTRRLASILVLLFFNALLRIKKKTAPLPSHPKRILICNIASFGDVVISTVVLPVLKRHYPNSEIGFLAASQAVQLLEEHPFITRVHSFDHWYGFRTQGFGKAFLRHFKSFRKSVREIRECNYELAIDLYPCFPNAIPLLSKTRIPVRMGHPTGGYSNLLTHSIPWSEKPEYMGQVHLNLLRTLGIDTRNASPLPCYLMDKAPLKEFPEEYLVVHMGTSHHLKEWDREKWVQLIRLLHDRGFIVVLTGQGEREQVHCDQVFSETGCYNYCNKLNWSDFVSVIQNAKMLISVDSVAVHLAAAVQIPSVILFTGINSPHMWIPPYPLCKPLMHQVSCAPCFKKQGCKQMSCIRKIQVEDVLRSVYALDLLHPRQVFPYF